MPDVRRSYTMSMFIDGWIELASALPAAEGADNAWRGVVHLGNLVIDDADLVSERLFGLSKRAVTEAVPGRFGRRGVPPNASHEVRTALSTIAVHEASFGKGESGGYTHAAWPEIASVPLSAADLEGSRWSVALAVARTLLQHSKLPPDHLRFVVWYSW